MTPCEPVEVHKSFSPFSNIVYVDIDANISLKTFIASYVSALKIVAATGDRIFVFVNNGKGSLLALTYTRVVLDQKVRLFIAESDPIPPNVGESNILRIALATHGEIEEFVRCIRSAVLSSNNKFSDVGKEAFDRKFWPIEWKNLYRYRGTVSQSFISFGNGSNNIE